MNLSRFLAAVMGWYFIIISLLVLLRYKVFERIARELCHVEAAWTLSGMIILVFGLIIAVSHSLWTPDWRFLVTLIGWILLIKGVSRLYFPTMTKHLTIQWLQRRYLNLISAILSLVIGIFLIYCAYN